MRRANPANKYGAKPTVIGGRRFDSKKEAARYQELLLLQRAGEIRNLELQVQIILQGRDGPVKTRAGKPMRLTVDFSYEDKRLNWALVYEDAKGKPTRDYEVRKAVAEAMGYTIKET